MNTQNYKQAITLFNDFLKKFPKSNLADNAQYWKGEALFALKDYPNSVMEFQKVITNYPKSDKVPGIQINRFCASGLQAIAQAAQAINATGFTGTTTIEPGAGADAVTGGSGCGVRSRAAGRCRRWAESPAA